MGKNSFILFDDLREPVSALTVEDAGHLFKAIFEYRAGNEIRGLSPSAQMAFTFIRQQIDRSVEQYEERCRQNLENIKKRWNKGDTSVYDRKNRNTKNTNVYDGVPPDPSPDNEPDPDIKNLAESADIDDIPGFDKAVAIPEPKEICAEDGAAIDKALYTAIKESCEAVDGDFTDYGKEGRAIHGLIKKARAKNKDDPSAFLKTLLETFLRLRQNGRDYWRSMPYTPSRINASGVFDGIVREMEMDRESGAMEADEGIAEILGGFYK